MEKKCPPGKIYNPDSKRCVLKSGKIGKKLLAQAKKPSQIVKEASQKKCPSGKIFNPKTKRCVSETGKIGKALASKKPITQQKQVSDDSKLEKKPTSEKVECPPDKIYNPDTKRCVSKKGKIGKKLLSVTGDHDTEKDGILNISKWKSEKPTKKGSNPAKIYYSPEGQKYYGKVNKNYERMETEHLASRLYQYAGVDAVQTLIAKDKNNFILLQKWIDNLRFPKPSDAKAIRKGFLIDVWLANWDAPLNDNIMMDANDNPIRLDVGGSLDYRAKGSKKQTTSTPFGKKVGQLTSMRKRGKYVDFKDIPEEEIEEQKKRLKQLSNEELYKIISSTVKEQKRAKSLFDILVARKNYIVSSRLL